MRSLLDRLVNPLHLLIALACTWLAASSPWIGMYQALPDEPGAINLGHVVLGLAVLPLGIAYVAACTVGGRWRLYFPWAAGQFGDIGRDLAGLFKGQRPGSEGGGLFAAIEGLLLIALLATALTGALWFLGRSTEAAIIWRDHHILAARGLVGLMVLHVVAVSLHFVDLVRD
jgi:Prokaryotic cytochrome b561